MLARMPEVFRFIGLGDLPRRDQRILAKMMYQDLELFVGGRLTNQLTSAQLAEFEEIIEYLSTHDVPPHKDPAMLWLQEVAPNYRIVVYQCVFFVISQLCDSVDRIADIACISVHPPRRSAEDAWDYLTSGGAAELVYM